MDESQFEEYLQIAEEAIADPPEMDEANTKAKVIRPLLETLGWDITTDVVLEYGFQMGSTTHHVDYALILEERPELFVEVKGSYTDLAERHLEQLSTYMKTQNIDWGLLTNGRTYYVCRRRVADNTNVVVDVLGEFSLEEFSNNHTLISALSKRSIMQGRSDEIASKVYEFREAYAELQEKRAFLSNEITDTIIAELGEHIARHAESAAEAALEELSTSIESDAMGIPEADPSGRFWSAVEAETGIVKQGSIVVIPDSKNATECFVDFVDFLFSHGYLQPEDIPIDSGPKRFLINDQPRDKSGEEMYSPKKVGNRFYLETNYSRNDIKQRILELYEHCRD